jgi:hypothetical protein
MASIARAGRRAMVRGLNSIGSNRDCARLPGTLEAIPPDLHGRRGQVPMKVRSLQRSIVAGGALTTSSFVCVSFPSSAT